jgi:methylenetetrahydrofolate reductase (NADPH)
MMRNMRWSLPAPLAGRLGTVTHRPASPVVRRVVADTSFELVPLKNLEAQLPHLPRGSHVSVTCSPAKGIEATLDLALRLKNEGLRPTPHVAARLVRDRAHVRDIAARLADGGFDELFLIAGDEETPAGDYHDGAALLEHLLEERHGLQRIGVPAYPDGHLFIHRDALHHALHHKQNLLQQAGVDGWASTQMCFDADTIASWLSPERRAGLTLPVRLGIPGPIDRTKLLTMGMRVGVGQSLRYLQKNRSGLTKLVTGTSYDPTRLLTQLADQLQPLNVTGLHLFTFNQLQASVAWQQGVVGAAPTT